jgi:hypothetical protein
VFNDEENHPGCEYVYVNITREEGEELFECWRRENRGIPVGCYWTAASGGGDQGGGGNVVAPESAGTRMEIGKVWGASLVASFVLMVAGMWIGTVRCVLVRKKLAEVVV